MIITSNKQSKYSEQQIDDLHERVQSVLKSSGVENEWSLVKVFKKFMREVEAISKGKRDQKKKDSPETAKNDDGCSSTKKVSMKTAGDVKHRIQWDDEIEKEFVTVGYLDRFLGLKECAFNTFDWGDIVLADINSLAIPEHRISYFKYKNELVWDKTTRLDNVFGSTGSKITIHDVIKQLKEKTFVPDDEPSTEEVNHVGRVRNGGKNEDQPNYFISIPINSVEIREKFSLLTNDLIESDPNVEELIVPASSLHLTLCTLRLNDKDEIQKVQQALKWLASDSVFLGENFPIRIKFEGVGEFYNKVMFVKCHSDDLGKLEKVRKTILKKLSDEEISTAGNYYDFRPHLTVFKISGESVSRGAAAASRNEAHRTVSEIVSKDMWKKYEDFKFGEMNVEELELCKMVNIFRSMAYPVEFTTKFNV